MPVKVAPAIYEGSLGWGWVQLDELCEILKITATELFRRYGALSSSAHHHLLGIEHEGKYSNVAIPRLIEMEDILVEQCKGKQEKPECVIAAWRKSLFVPAGWAADVLEAYRQGYIRVELKCVSMAQIDSQDPSNLKVTYTGNAPGFWVAVGYKTERQD